VTAKITEHLHDAASGLDARPAAEVAAILAEGQIAAALALRGAVPHLAQAAGVMARSLRSGGALHYAAAGSSGLMAAADAQELGGTFSVPASQLCIHMAGGLPTGVEMPGGTEDDTAGLEQALSSLTARDTVIAISASGSTPYTLTAARIAKAHEATLIAIANNAAAPLLALADHPILLATPPEVLSGSTRMGTGTAQKIALNVLSTLMAVELGHIHDGMMVNLHADNAKLRDRARRIVVQIAKVSDNAASEALRISEGDVKTAIVMAAKGVSRDAAQAALDASDGFLRPILNRPNEP
jgi:N-acetylmuramic acid 6-phosphate etherase